MRGVALLVETIEKITDRLNPRLQVDGILATMYDGRTLHSREVVKSVVDHFGDRVFHTVISRTVKFPDAKLWRPSRSRATPPRVLLPRHTGNWPASSSPAAARPEPRHPPADAEPMTVIPMTVIP